MHGSPDLLKAVSVPPGFLRADQEEQVHGETMVLGYVILDEMLSFTGTECLVHI